MSNPFNPQRPKDSALNAVMAGAMGTGSPGGPPVIVATSPIEYTNGQDIAGFITQALARKTANGRVADDGTDFIIENLVLGGNRAEIPSKKSISGNFTGPNALSMKGRILTSGGTNSILRLTAGPSIEPTSNWNVLVRVFSSLAGDPLLQAFYKNTGGTATQLASTSNYPIAETATMSISRTGGLFVFTMSTPTLGTIVANIATSSVQNGSADLFGNAGRESLINNTDKYEIKQIGGYPVS